MGRSIAKSSPRQICAGVKSIVATHQVSAKASVALALVGILGLAGIPSGAQSQEATPPTKASLLKNYGKIPLHFEANVGQAAAEAKFVSRGNGYAVFLTSSEAVLVLHQNLVAKGQPVRHKPASRGVSDLLADRLWEEPRIEDENSPQAVLRTRLVRANPDAVISAGEELPGKSNYFMGDDPKKWRTNIPSYGRVKYNGVYPGVDLVYYGNQAQLEYDFVVAPGASPKPIRLAISGNEISSQAAAPGSSSLVLRVDKDGDLVVTSRTREVRYQKPIAYQISVDGQKQLVPARFVLKSKNEVGFAVASYDRTRTLVIDPTLIYSTYIAGATPGFYYYGYTGDQAAAIAVDSNGSAYITGLTESADFPITSGAYQTTCKPYGLGCGGVPNSNPSSATAVFVTKLSPDGSSLVYSTYLGGGYNDNGAGIAVDSSGNVYIAGTTDSPDFPTTAGAYQTVCSPELDELHGFCSASGIVSKCGAQGVPDGFVTKLNSTGSALLYSTFLGGSLNDYLTGIAVNQAGEAYVSGFTLSSYSYGGLYYGCGPGSATATYGYPITPGGYFPGALPAPPAGQPWPFGSPSAFTQSPNSVGGYPFGSNHTPVFSKLSADGSTLLYSTYIGGGFGPAFPSPGSTTLGDGQTFYPYLQQHATGIAVDSSGDAYLTGWSNASDLCCTQFNNYQFSGFPTTPGAVQPHNASDCVNGNCNYDGFVAKFDPTQSGASSLVYSTNLGGRGDDYANAIAVDSGGNAYVAGTANRSGNGAPATFPTTQGTVQPNCPGDCSNNYGWVAKLDPAAGALDYATYLSGNSGTTSPYGITVDSAGNAYVAGQTQNNGFPQQNPLQGYCGGALTCAFISVLDPTASTLSFSTYLGSDNQNAYANNGAAGIALDSFDNIYVTGSTTSSSFPTTTGAFQTTCSKCSSGSWGMFVSEISALQQAQKTTTTTALQSSLNPSVFSQSVTFTATVTPSGGTGTPTGTVTFMDGSSTLGTGSLDVSGNATYATSTLSVGTHSITAVYGGDTNFSQSTSPALSQVVGKVSTNTSLASPANPSTFGQPVTFTATVSSSATGTPTGAVTFMDGGTTLGTSSLNSNGQATYSTSSLAVGTHSITASYGGDTNFSGSTSSTLPQAVSKIPTTTSLQSSLNPSRFGQSVTFTAAINWTGPGTPTGTVSFSDGVVQLCSSPVDNTAHATCVASSLAAGSHSITDSYSGDSDFLGSTSAALNQSVNQASTTTSVVSSLNPSVYLQSVTFTATVAPQFGGAPTGTISFKDGVTLLCASPVDNSGHATCMTSTLTTGSHSITASYLGDSNFLGSTSSTLTETVNKSNTITSLTSSLNPSKVKQSVAFTATVMPGIPTGNAQFFDGKKLLGTQPLVNGVAKISTASLSKGTHSIKAVYSGDSNFNSSTSAVLNQVVQ